MAHKLISLANTRVRWMDESLGNEVNGQTIRRFFFNLISINMAMINGSMLARHCKVNVVSCASFPSLINLTSNVLKPNG